MPWHKTPDEDSMLTHHGTYLIRCWKRGDETCRVEVVHVQTGERVLLHSTSAALAWIDGRGRDVPSGASQIVPE
jgi:hypothetical protein